MIGVLSRDSECFLVKEFFELFKVSWEFWRDHGCYEAIVSFGVEPPRRGTVLTIFYGSRETAFDKALGLRTSVRGRGEVARWKGERLPLYGACLTFETGKPILRLDEDQEVAS